MRCSNRAHLCSDFSIHTDSINRGAKFSFRLHPPYFLWAWTQTSLKEPLVHGWAAPPYLTAFYSLLMPLFLKKFPLPCHLFMRITIPSCSLIHLKLWPCCVVHLSSCLGENHEVRRRASRSPTGYIGTDLGEAAKTSLVAGRFPNPSLFWNRRLLKWLLPRADQTELSVGS